VTLTRKTSPLLGTALVQGYHRKLALDRPARSGD
jgi:hypothetical protein